MGFDLVIGFIDLIQFVTTSKNYTLTVLHTSQITIGHTRSSHSLILTSRYLVAASNDGRSPSSRFPNGPRPQLPVSKSNSSQQLNQIVI
jgi:hypothetical protein